MLEKSEVMQATPRAQSEVLLSGDRLDQSEQVWAPRHPGSLLSLGSEGRMTLSSTQDTV